MEKGTSDEAAGDRRGGRVFNQRGFAGHRCRNSWRLPGLKKGGIYRHFAGKEELALEAFDHASEVAERLRFERSIRIRDRWRS